MTFSEVKQVKRLPITNDEAGPLENDKERFERYIRQISRCICACNLCELGKNKHSFNGILYDSHSNIDLKFKQIALIKYQPNSDDIANGMFNELKAIANEFSLNIDEFYKTSIVKCIGDYKEEYDCPYFRLEIKAALKLFKLIILYDEKSLKHFNIDIVDKFHTINDCRIYGCGDIKKIFKLIKASKFNQQIYNSLFV